MQRKVVLVLLALSIVAGVAGVAGVARAELAQPQVNMKSWVYEPQPLPPLSEIVAQPQAEIPTYGLYLWASEYVQFHENVSKVGWKSFRIAGPFSDECMKLVAQDGSHVMVTLGVHVQAIKGVKGGRRRTDYDSDDAFVADYVSAVVAFLERYGPGGKFFKENPDVPNHPITAIEIWNEPNFQYMIPDPKYPAENEAARKIRAEVETRREKLYSRVLPETYNAVKARWPGVTVVGFGCGGASAGDKRFILHLHELVSDLVDKYDVLSTHPYARPASPESYMVRSWGRFSAADSLKYIRGVMKKQGKIKPVWWTEYGWPVSQADGGIFPDRDTRDYSPPILQAANIVRGYMWAMRVGVERVHTMHVTDTDGFNGGFFVDRAEQRWRPSAYAVKTIIALMPNPKLVGAYADGEDGWFAYRFTAEPGAKDEVVAVWNVTGPRKVTLPLKAGVYKLTDMIGDTKEVKATAAGLELQIGPCPVYITAP